MALQDKYAELLQSANNLGVANLAVSEQNGVLHVAGTTNSTADYDTLVKSNNRLFKPQHQKHTQS